jgi:hypothetical protein
MVLVSAALVFDLATLLAALVGEVIYRLLGWMLWR